MVRSESFPSAGVACLAIRLARAALTILPGHEEDVRLHISGPSENADALLLRLNDGCLHVEEPSSLRLKAAPLQLTLRLPPSWKGSVRAITRSGALTVQGLSGADLALSTVTGGMQLQALSSITTSLRSVSGVIRAQGLSGQSLRVRSLLGGAELTDCAYDVYRITGVRGSTSLHMLQGFDQLDGLMISGSLHVTAPMDSVDAVLHTVTGRLRTQGVALVQDAPRASVTTVSGHFEMNSSLLAATYEEE